MGRRRRSAFQKLGCGGFARPAKHATGLEKNEDTYGEDKGGDEDAPGDVPAVAGIDEVTPRAAVPPGSPPREERRRPDEDGCVDNEQAQDGFESIHDRIPV